MLCGETDYEGASPLVVYSNEHDAKLIAENLGKKRISGHEIIDGKKVNTIHDGQWVFDDYSVRKVATDLPTRKIISKDFEYDISGI